MRRQPRPSPGALLVEKFTIKEKKSEFELPASRAHQADFMGNRWRPDLVRVESEVRGRTEPKKLSGVEETEGSSSAKQEPPQNSNNQEVTEESEILLQTVNISHVSENKHIEQQSLPTTQNSYSENLDLEEVKESETDDTPLIENGKSVATLDLSDENNKLYENRGLLHIDDESVAIKDDVTTKVVNKSPIVSLIEEKIFIENEDVHSNFETNQSSQIPDIKEHKIKKIENKQKHNKEQKNKSKNLIKTELSKITNKSSEVNQKTIVPLSESDSNNVKKLKKETESSGHKVDIKIDIKSDILKLSQQPLNSETGDTFQNTPVKIPDKTTESLSSETYDLNLTKVKGQKIISRQTTNDKESISKIDIDKNLVETINSQNITDNKPNNGIGKQGTAAKTSNEDIAVPPGCIKTKDKTSLASKQQSTLVNKEYKTIDCSLNEKRLATEDTFHSVNLESDAKISSGAANNTSLLNSETDSTSSHLGYDRSVINRTTEVTEDDERTDKTSIENDVDNASFRNNVKENCAVESGVTVKVTGCDLSKIDDVIIIVDKNNNSHLGSVNNIDKGYESGSELTVEEEEEEEEMETGVRKKKKIIVKKKVSKLQVDGKPPLGRKQDASKEAKAGEIKRQEKRISLVDEQLGIPLLDRKTSITDEIIIQEIAYLDSMILEEMKDTRRRKSSLGFPAISMIPEGTEATLNSEPDNNCKIEQINEIGNKNKKEAEKKSEDLVRKVEDKDTTSGEESGKSMRDKRRELWRAKVAQRSAKSLGKFFKGKVKKESSSSSSEEGKYPAIYKNNSLLQQIL